MAENLWKTNRLIFRAVEPSDDPFLHEINRHSANLVNAAPFLPLPQNQKDINGFREYLEAALVGVLICLPEEKWEGNDRPKPIGAMTLSQMPKSQQHHRVSGIGINILPEYTGKGYGSEAIKWALEYAFMTIGLHRVDIGCFEFNYGAIKLYRRLHFVDEGYVCLKSFELDGCADGSLGSRGKACSARGNGGEGISWECSRMNGGL